MTDSRLEAETVAVTTTGVTPALPETACCRNCDYLLRGLPRAVCPECGRVFDPADPRSYALVDRRRRVRRRRMISSISIVFPGGDNGPNRGELGLGIQP